MPYRIVPDGAKPCVWMSAGLLAYKICDREFDCDRCPLDAGLREGSLVGSRGEGHLAAHCYAGVFPEDRRYSRGHLWLKAVGRQEERRQRLGLDAFAAAIIGHCDGVKWEVWPRTVAQDEVLCQIDLGLGMLFLEAPLGGVVVEGNQSLRGDPGLLVTAPYEDGWILELQVLDGAELNRLMTPAAARDAAQMDFRRFRRRIAVQLFAEGQALGQSMADGGELITDLRQMLGGSGYLELLQEMIH